MPLQGRGLILDLDLAHTNTLLKVDDKIDLLNIGKVSSKANLYYQKQAVSSV